MASQPPPLRNIDLNLLLVLSKLLETRSVARTAAALAMSPSAVSHALARLRQALDDELFVRTADGLLPTKRAAALEPDLMHGLKLLAQAVAREQTFEPRTASLTFRVATTDFGARLLLPRLLRHLEKEAPGVQVIIRPLPVDTEEALARGALDAMIGVYTGNAPSLYRQRLFGERTSVLARNGHPRTRDGTISLADYLACGHILIAPRGRTGSRIDALLSEQGLSRHIAVLIPEFLLGPHLVAETDHLLTAGDRLLRSAAERLPVCVLHPPFPAPAFQVHLVWHARLHSDQAFRWFRELLVSLHHELYYDEDGDAPADS